MCSYAGLVVSLQSALAYPDWPGPNLTLLRNALQQTGWDGPIPDRENWRIGSHGYG
jgi:hypothetical protein